MVVATCSGPNSAQCGTNSMPWASHSAAILRTSVTPPVLATSGIRGNSRVSTTSRPCEKASPQPTVSRTRVRPATSSSSRSSFCADASARASLYLASKYAGPVHSVDPKALGLATQWSFWANLEMEALLLGLLQHRAVLPEFARDASYAERDELLLRRPLGVLNSALNGRDYLTDSSFTVADLNLASILAWGAWIYRLIRISAMARQLFGATCLRPS